MTALGGERARRLSPTLTRRRAARLAAVQALYQLALGGESEATVLHQFAEHRLGREQDGMVLDAEVAFFTALVRGVGLRRAEIDAQIDSQLKTGRETGRLEVVLLAIIEAAVYELLACIDVPAKVVVAEYVAIAADFFVENEVGLANGIIDRLARRLRASEFGDEPGAHGSE
ncbi:MAG: transcription antitermination factor NusB [Alphaproteobacteria bacterium]|nr:transcription antitermination factor NusB [Alphaproteobacteria bacterium]